MSREAGEGKRGWVMEEILHNVRARRKGNRGLNEGVERRGSGESGGEYDSRKVVTGGDDPVLKGAAAGEEREGLAVRETREVMDHRSFISF